MKGKTISLILLTLFALTIIPLASASPAWDKNPKAFIHGLAVNIEGEEYWFKGPGSIPGAVDVPGHSWVQTGPYRVVGRHYNVGPSAAPAGTPWWATGEPYGVLLYKVDGIISTQLSRNFTSMVGLWPPVQITKSILV
jgi:hypothetical protein